MFLIVAKALAVLKVPSVYLFTSRSTWCSSAHLQTLTCRAVTTVLLLSKILPILRGSFRARGDVRCSDWWVVHLHLSARLWENVDSHNEPC